jgi:hypothetical protein
MSVSGMSCYTLDQVNQIIFNGFDYYIDPETHAKITKLAMEVGSPDYVRTPVFPKREVAKPDKRKKKVSQEIKDEDWENLKNFKPTKMEEKDGITAKIDSIRINVNKMTDKNYVTLRDKILITIDEILKEGITNEEMHKISSTIFDIAATNRFYSKLYADLFTELHNKYVMFREAFIDNFNNYKKLFDTIEYVDSSVDYNKFCENNKNNEKRKAMCQFYVNLYSNKLIEQSRIYDLIADLTQTLHAYISMYNKKNEVDELCENIAILFTKELIEEDCDACYALIDGKYTITEVVKMIAESKASQYKSLTNKSIFKFMDIVDNM